MAALELFRSINRECGRLRRRATAMVESDRAQLAQELLDVVDQASRFSHLERFAVIQQAATAAPTDDDPGTGINSGGAISGDAYRTHLSNAWDRYRSSVTQRLGSRAPTSTRAWDRFRADETSLLVDDGFSFNEATLIARSASDVSKCSAFLASQSSIEPGRGFTVALTSFRTALSPNVIAGSFILGVISNIERFNKLQTLLDIDADLAEAGLDFPLAQLSGTVADVSGHILAVAEVVTN